MPKYLKNMVDRFGLGCWIYWTFIIMSSPVRGEGKKHIRRKNE